MDPDYGEKWPNDGSGTNRLTFAHTVAEPSNSTQGIAVLANTPQLNGGTIRSGVSQTDADLVHAGLPHDPAHQVDWRRLELSFSQAVQGDPRPVPGQCTVDFTKEDASAGAIVVESAAVNRGTVSPRGRSDGDRGLRPRRCLAVAAWWRGRPCSWASKSRPSRCICWIRRVNRRTSRSASMRASWTWRRVGTRWRARPPARCLVA